MPSTARSGRRQGSENASNSPASAQANMATVRPSQSRPLSSSFSRTEPRSTSATRPRPPTALPAAAMRSSARAGRPRSSASACILARAYSGQIGTHDQRPVHPYFFEADRVPGFRLARGCYGPERHHLQLLAEQPVEAAGLDLHEVAALDRREVQVVARHLPTVKRLTPLPGSWLCCPAAAQSVATAAEPPRPFGKKTLIIPNGRVASPAREGCSSQTKGPAGRHRPRLLVWALGERKRLGGLPGMQLQSTAQPGRWLSRCTGWMTGSARTATALLRNHPPA
jgi:hypothetical protein